MGMQLPPELEAKILAMPGVMVNGRPVPLVEAPAPDADAAEKDFMARLLKLLGEHGFRTFHTKDSRKSAAGFPDIVAVKKREFGVKRILYVETKTEKGRASAAQLDWIEDLQDAGAEVYLWRPSDWPEILQILAAKTRSRRCRGAGTQHSGK